MSADIVTLFSAEDGTKTIGELMDEANSVPARRLRAVMLKAAKTAGELPPNAQATPEEMRLLLTLGAHVTRYLFNVCNIPRNRNARL
jgi:hypothetical protein